MQASTSHQHTSNQSNTTQISRKLLRMDVLTSETCWAVNNEIIKQVTSSWSLSLFNYQDDARSNKYKTSMHIWLLWQADKFHINLYSLLNYISYKLNKIMLCTFFFCAAALSRSRPPHYWGFTITFRHTTLGRSPLYEWSARHRDPYLTTHNTQQTDIHGPGGIRTHNPSKRAAAGQCVRPRGHWDRRFVLVALWILPRTK